MQECALGRPRLVLNGSTLASGRALGEEAVDVDELSADAHFALLCNLREQLRVAGESLSSLFGFRRMVKKLNRTLELTANHLDALSAKGTVLVRLPVFLDGDTEKEKCSCIRELLANQRRSIPG